MATDDSPDAPARRGLDAWAAFPAHRDPRPVVLLDMIPPVYLVFSPDEQTRLALLHGAVEAVPGFLDDRKRQEASAFVWAHVTQGEPRFAPRPIEAAQPESVRGDWAAHRANTWGKLARPGRIIHYAELRKLLIEHVGQLAGRIDRSEDIIVL